MAGTTRARKKPDETTSAVRFIIDGKAYEIDVEALTWGEVGEVEKYFNQSFEEVNLETGRGMLVLAYLALRRKTPSATIADIESLRLDQLEVEAVERPTKTPANGGDPQ